MEFFEGFPNEFLATSEKILLKAPPKAVLEGFVLAFLKGPLDAFLEAFFGAPQISLSRRIPKAIPGGIPRGIPRGKILEAFPSNP